jgi:hypothetical protein
MESERVRDRTKPTTEVNEVGGEIVEGGEEKRGESSRPKRPITAPSSDRTSQRPQAAQSSTSTYKGKGKARDQNFSTRPPRPQSRYPTDQTQSAPPPPKRQRALSPIPISDPMPITDLRQLKKDAYSKYHPPTSASSGGRMAPGGSMTRSGGTGIGGTLRSGGTGLGGMFGFGNGGKVRGQPNMGARMGVLLEQIQRDRGQKI